MSDANKYTARLAGHYVDLERFVQAIYESTQPLAELRSAAETLPLEFDIDTAVGVQLDAVGERVGVSRKLKTPLEGVYFAFDEDEVGFDEGVWKDDFDPSEGMVSLDDEFYRLVIKAKIAANSWDGTNDTLDDVLSIVFNEKIGTYASATDTQDMTMTIGLSGKRPTPILLELLTKGYLDVKPGGVRIDYYITATEDGPLFAFDVENEYFAGFDEGVWGEMHKVEEE